MTAFELPTAEWHELNRLVGPRGPIPMRVTAEFLERSARGLAVKTLQARRLVDVRQVQEGRDEFEVTVTFAGIDRVQGVARRAARGKR